MARNDTAHATTLTFRDIHIARLEGIRDPYRIEHLCPGVNLIHGPNGIGKSRTALALQAMIWPGTCPGGGEITGNVAAAEDQWRVELDGGRASYQRNGVPETTRVLVPTSAEHRDRYLLTLHDLLRADNRNFAREIAREASGGYDFERVRSEMGIDRAYSRPRGLVQALQKAEGEVVTLRRIDLELQGEERSLAGLYAERDEAISASESVRLLKIARSHTDALVTLAERHAVRDGFAEQVRRMTGEEYADARQYRDLLDQARTRYGQLEYAIERDVRDLAATGFGAGTIPHTLVDTLRHRLDRAKQHLADLKQAERQRETASTLLTTYRRRLAAEITEAQMTTLDSEGLRAFTEHAVEMREVRQLRELEEAIRQWLGDIEPPGDVDVLRSGVDLLQQYLGEVRSHVADQPPFDRWVLIGAAAVIAFQAVGLALTASIWMLALALAAAPLLLIAIRSGVSPDSGAERLQETYSHLGLAGPAEWSVEQVQARLAVLQRELGDAILEEQKFHRWQALTSRRQELEARWRELNEKSQELLATYGISGSHDPHSLELIATAIDRWRGAGDDLARANASQETASRLFRETLAAINTEIRNHGGDKVTDVSTASSEINHLAARIAKAEKLEASLTRDRHRLENEIRPEVKRLERQLATVYQAVGLEPGDDGGLKTLCDEVEHFSKAQRAWDEATVVVKTRRAELVDAPTLLELSREEIERDLAHAEALAARRDELQARISEIETSLRQARGETRLEEANARLARASDELESARQREYEDAASRRLFGFIRDQNHQLNRPAVLRVADRYFALFTAGAYELRVGEGPDADLLAVDTVTGRALSLDQLSSGTRVQLLLAVRLAFIEVTEQGVRLPIILDEVLGNTDDVRATAIIDSAIAIARQGRQVFYFTAQRDEIGKWISRLNAHDDAPPSQIIDLAEVRQLARAGTPVTFDWDPSIFDRVTIPDGASHADLRALLAVPPIDFWAEEPDAVNLWYLIQDVDVLITLHRRGVRRWGQYRALHRNRLLDGAWCEHVHAQAVVRARIIEVACRNWRTGRPRPVTAECLDESGLVSDAFRDEVHERAASCAWDGAALINALRNREVPNFRQSIADRLEAWLREHQHITDAEPLDHDMIRAAAFSAAATEIEQGLIDAESIDDLLQSMAGEPVLAQ